MPRPANSTKPEDASAPHIDAQIDVRGYNCPIPLLRAKKALAGMHPGEILKVVTTDPGAEIDFKVFAEASGNALVALDQRDHELMLLIEKKRP
jgi:tRNA 2-thiouridine synthesizing protein A